MEPLASKEAGRTLSDGAFEQIQGAIVEGEIAPGTRISEQYLMDRFGISRGPLREAIRRLEGRRLLLRVPHAGVRVVSLSHAELIELYHVREALEGMACRLAARCMSEAEIAGLREVLAAHERHAGLQRDESYHRQQGDLDIHYRIIQGSRNQMLNELLCADLYHLVRMYRNRYASTARRPQQAFAEHHHIIDAIADRDGELAEILMRRHISASRRSIEQRLQSQQAGAIESGEAIP